MTLGVHIGVILLVLMVALIIGQRLNIMLSRQRHSEQELMIASLLEEKRALDELMNLSVDERYLSLVRHRTDLISRILAAGLSGDTSQSDAVLEEVDKLVSDREEFMRQTRIIYEGWQPEMMARLKECELTEREVEVCCLYALGLNGKGIQQYTGDGRHYQNVGLIRKKLGLGEHDKNIDGYIKSLIK